MMTTIKTEEQIQQAVAGNLKTWKIERKKRSPDTRFIILIEAYLWTLGVFPPGSFINKLARSIPYKFFGFNFSRLETYSEVIERIAEKHLNDNNIDYK